MYLRAESIVEQTFERFSLGATLWALRRSAADVFLVGGAVRDALRSSALEPADIDLMTAGDPGCLREALGHLGEPRLNRHGNMRYQLPDGRHMDVIHTRNFYGRTRSVVTALQYFDVSVNAIAVSVGRDPILLDPIDGARHLAEGRLVLPQARWIPSHPFEDVHVVLRTIRLVERTGLRISNPQLARVHRTYFPLVDWDDLERLNGFGMAEAERRYVNAFQSADGRVLATMIR